MNKMKSLIENYSIWKYEIECEFKLVISMG